MDFVYEWRQNLQRPKDVPPALSLEPIEGANFRSVYAFPPETAAVIKRNESVGGLWNHSVRATHLFVDVDEDEHVETVERKIAALGVGFSRWTTGNRGAHFHIDTEAINHPHLPYSQAEFIRSLDLQELVDMSIYRHHSIFRVPGAIHQDTKQLKECLYYVDGPVLSIPIVIEPEPEYTHIEEGTEEAIRTFKRNLLQRRGVGRRHTHLFILFETGINAGHDIDTVLEYLYWWNAQQKTPHSEDTIYRKWKGFVNGKKRRFKSNRPLPLAHSRW